MHYSIALGIVITTIVVILTTIYYTNKKMQIIKRAESPPIKLVGKIKKLRIASMIMLIITIFSNFFYLIYR
jgi:heme A synthase